MGRRHGPKVISDNLRLYLDSARYSSGSTWYDISGNDNNAVNTGTMPAHSTSNGGYFNFVGGSTNELSIPNDSSLQITGDLTIEYTWYPVNRSARRNVLNKAYGGWYTITHETDGDLGYYYGSSGTDAQTYGYYTTGDTPLATLNQWYHITVVRNETGGRWIKMYFNGIEHTGSKTYLVTPSCVAGTNPVIIGNGYTNPAYGRLGLLRLYAATLSASDIQNNFNATRGRYGL